MASIRLALQTKSNGFVGILSCFTFLADDWLNFVLLSWNENKRIWHWIGKKVLKGFFTTVFSFIQDRVRNGGEVFIEFVSNYLGVRKSLAILNNT